MYDDNTARKFYMSHVSNTTCNVINIECKNIKGERAPPCLTSQTSRQQCEKH